MHLVRQNCSTLIAPKNVFIICNSEENRVCKITHWTLHLKGDLWQVLNKPLVIRLLNLRQSHYVDRFLTTHKQVVAHATTSEEFDHVEINDEYLMINCFHRIFDR